MGYDAEIRISTKVDTGQMRKLQAEIDKSTYKVDALSKRYKELKNQKAPTEEYKRLQKEISEATKKVEKLGSAKVPTQEYKVLKDSMEKCKFELDSLLEEQNKLTEKGLGKEIDKEYLEAANSVKYWKQQLQEAILLGNQDTYLAVEDKLNRAKSILQELMAKEPKVLGDIAYYERVENNIKRLSSNISGIETEMEGLVKEGKAFTINAEADEATKKVAELTEKTEKLVREGKAFTLGKDTDEFKKVSLDLESEKAHLTQLINKQKDLGHKQVKVSDGLKKIGTAGKKAFRGINVGAKKTGSLFKTLGSRLKGILLSLLIFNWISKGFNLMVSSMREGFKNLAQYSDEYNRSMSNLMNSGNQLKNNLAAAFEPIANSILPQITKLIDYLNSAAEAFSRFMAVMSGKKTYTRAVRKNDDYAKSLKGTADSAKEAAGAVQDTAEEVEKLAAFDNIDVLEKQSNTQSNHMANRYGSDTSGFGPTNQTNFEEVETGQISGWLASLKDAITNGDWYSVGALFAEKVNGIFSGIDWTTIKGKAKETAGNIANFLNGYIDGTDWKLCGSTIANGLMTAFIFANTFVTAFRWEKLGKGMADGINGFFATMDWSYVGKTIGNGLNAAFLFLYGFVKNLDYKMIAGSIAGSINSFLFQTDWKQAGKTIGAGLQGAITFLKEFVKKLDWKGIVKACGEILSGFFEEIDLGDVAVILSVILGAKIAKGIAGIGISAIKKKFGSWVASRFIPAIISMLETGFSSATFAATGAAIIQHLVAAVAMAIIGWNVGQLLYEVITGEKIDMTWTEQFKTIFDSLKDGSWKEACKMWGQDIAAGAKEGFETNCKLFKKSMELFKQSNLKILSFLGEKWTKGMDGIGSVIGKFSDTAKKKWTELFKTMGNTELGKAIKKPVNTVIYGMEKMINSVISGLNAMVDAMNNLKFDIPDWIPAIGGKSFGLNLTKLEAVDLPKLATGAVFRGGDPYAAIVNDQPRGQTNIETPLATMLQAFNQALDSRGNGPVEVVIQFAGDNAQLARHLNPILAEESARRGVSLVVKGV